MLLIQGAKGGDIIAWAVLAVLGVGGGGEVDIDKQMPDTHMQPY